MFTGVNRKTCPICKNSFSGNSALKTHMLTHSKSKPHQCQKCSKKFIDQRTLERHWKTHSGDAYSIHFSKKLAQQMQVINFLSPKSVFRHFKFSFHLFFIQITNFTSAHYVRRRVAAKTISDGMFEICIRNLTKSCARYWRKFLTILKRRKMN